MSQECSDVVLLQEQRCSLLAGLIRMEELLSESEVLLKSKDLEIQALRGSNREVAARLHGSQKEVARLERLSRVSCLEVMLEEDEEEEVEFGGDIDAKKQYDGLSFDECESVTGSPNCSHQSPRGQNSRVAQRIKKAVGRRKMRFLALFNSTRVSAQTSQ